MWSAKMKAREIKMRPEARKATKKRPLSSPSRTPPLPIVLATPYSKPLASPSEAEKVEVMKVDTNKMVDWREKSPIMMVFRLVLCPTLALPFKNISPTSQQTRRLTINTFCYHQNEDQNQCGRHSLQEDLVKTNFSQIFSFLLLTNRRIRQS